MIDNIKCTERFFQNVKCVKVETKEIHKRKGLAADSGCGLPCPSTPPPNPLTPQTPRPYS